MTFTHADELVLLAMLLGVAALLTLAPIARVPYPILLVLGGLAFGVVPGMPRLELPPDLVLIAVLPPLLYGAAFFTSLRELRRNLRPVALLSIGLVLATTVAVAVAAHVGVGLPWASAFVLGAVVSPTDPIAASEIARRYGIPRRVIAVIEGESLLNDGTGLVAYRVAVAAVVAGTFSPAAAGGRFVLTVLGGIAIGLAVGHVVRLVRRRLDDPPTEITISLLTGYFAYLPAEALGVSAVLAAVTAGIYLGWHAPELTTVQQRLQGTAVWEIATFILNALLFTLIGLQLPTILDSLSNRSALGLTGDAALVAAAVIAIRFVWIFPATYVPRALSARIRERDPAPPWQQPALLAWCGMRGAVSLAAALAVPLATSDGAPFPGRDLIVFLTFGVILATLVGQGLTLPAVIGLLGLRDDGAGDRQEADARIHAAEAALARLAELRTEEWVREETASRLHGAYRFRVDRFQSRLDDGDSSAIEERSAAFQRLRRELLEAERAAIIALRSAGHIDDDIMHRVERDLDLEDARLDL